MGRLNWTRSNQETRIAKYGYESAHSDFEIKNHDTHAPCSQKTNKPKKIKLSKAEKHANRLEELNRYSTPKSLETIKKFNTKKKTKRIRHLDQLLSLLKQHSLQIELNEKFKIVAKFVERHRDLLSLTPTEIGNNITKDNVGPFISQIDQKSTSEEKYGEKLRIRLQEFEAKNLGQGQIENTHIFASIRGIFNKIKQNSWEINEELLVKAKKIIDQAEQNKQDRQCNQYEISLKALISYLKTHTNISAQEINPKLQSLFRIIQNIEHKNIEIDPDLLETAKSFLTYDFLVHQLKYLKDL